MRMLHPRAVDRLSDEDLLATYDYPVDRSWWRLNFVASLDGSVQGRDGRSGTLSSEADQRLFSLLRNLCDVVVVGAGTARVEGYAPVRRDEVRASLRERLGLAPLPPIAVISRKLDVPDVLLSGDGARTLVITCESSPADRREAIAEVADVVVVGDETVDLRAARAAFAERGLTRVLAEGGPQLARDLVAEQVLDELCLTLRAELVGGPGRRVTSGPLIEPPTAMELTHLLVSGSDLFARYRRLAR